MANEHDITLVTAKSSAVTIEGMKTSLATAAGGITPATLTAMVGLSQGGALQVAPVIGATLATMTSQISALITANTAPSLALAATLTTAQNNLTWQKNALFAAGPSGFGSIMNQAVGHINDAVEIKTTSNFIANTAYEDYGSGITSMSSMSTQGLDSVVGSLSSAATAIAAAGPCFDMSNMSTFGSGAGFFDKLSSVKLGNASGLSGALKAAGLDMNNLSDPENAPMVNNVLASIKDPAVIATVTDQLGITPPATLTSLKDFTDLTKLVPASSVAGLKSGLTDMATKFTDLGARFTSPKAATSMLSTISTPTIPTLAAASTSLSGLMSDLSGPIATMTGTGSGPLGLPSITNFTESVSGGPNITAMQSAIASGDYTAMSTASASINSMVSGANVLLSKAGVDLTTLPAASMSTAMSFATSLHKIGAGADGLGGADILKGMITADKFGDAITASLAEGKNKAAMALHGINPLKFG